MTEPFVLSETNESGVTRITLNRPQIHNAFDEVLIAQLTEAARAAGKDRDCRVVVLQAAGPHVGVVGVEKVLVQDRRAFFHGFQHVGNEGQNLVVYVDER